MEFTGGAGDSHSLPRGGGDGGGGGDCGGCSQAEGSSSPGVDRHVVPVQHRREGVMIPTVCLEARVLVERPLLLANWCVGDIAYVPINSGTLLLHVGASLPTLWIVVLQPHKQISNIRPTRAVPERVLVYTW